MHPAIMRQLVADRIREIHATADDERRARQARRAQRRAPSTRLRRPASGALSYDDPHLDERPQPVITEQPSAAPLPVMAGSRPDGGDGTTRGEALDHCH